MAQVTTKLAGSTTCKDRISLHVEFEHIKHFQSEFATNLKLGALFVGTHESLKPGTIINVVLDLKFCGAAVSIVGEVVSVVTASLAEASGTEAGISVRFADHPFALRERLERLAGISLETNESADVEELEPEKEVEEIEEERRDFPREDSNATIQLETPHGTFPGQTANISYTGALALIEGVSVPMLTDVRVRLADPSVELDLIVDGRIIRQTPCDNGIMAHGVQLLYPADRIDEVHSFIDFLQGFDHARRLGTIAGYIENGDLRTILELFVETSPFGTLTVTHKGEEGKIAFSDHQILYAMIGLVSGMKALARMLAWTSGRFEFHPNVDLRETSESPQSVEAAMLVAAVQLDEIANMDISSFDPVGTLDVDSTLLANVAGDLSEVEKEVVDYAAAGFTLDAVLDVIPDTDAKIYKALIELRERGVIQPNSP